MKNTMKNTMKKILMAALAVVSSDATAQSPPVACSRIVIIGDSTAHSIAPLAGWGDALPFVTLDSVVYNYGLPSASTKSYWSTLSWTRAKAALTSDSCLLIQFGINDAVIRDAARYVSVADFSAQLRAYAAEAVAVGATPVIVTATATQDPISNPYVAAALSVSGYRTIDLNALERSAYTTIGRTRLPLYFGDSVHHNARGALLAATLVAGAL